MNMILFTCLNNLDLNITNKNEQSIVVTMLILEFKRCFSFPYLNTSFYKIKQETKKFVFVSCEIIYNK